MQFVTEALYVDTKLGDRKDYGQVWNSIEFDWVAPVLRGRSLTFYRRKMRTLYKGRQKVKVYHGTSLSNANNILKKGFTSRASRGRQGIFVSTQKNVGYALEHTYSSNEEGVIVECEAYLKRDGYKRDGNTVILDSPLSIIPLKVYKTKKVNIAVSGGPPMLGRSKTINRNGQPSLFDI